jgi:hypothetical protein
MFNDILSASNNVILVNRLNRATQNIQGESFATKEEYQESIYTAVNTIFNIGNNMTPFVPIVGGTPAIVGSVTTNFTNLNNDAVDIVDQLESLETDVARLFNLAEAAQNSIRQQIREALYYNTTTMFTEPFINSRNIATNAANVDYSPGRVTLPLVSSTQLQPTISLGIDCVGSSVTNVSELSAGLVTSLYTWTGSILNLTLAFATPTIVNRVVLVLDDYSSMQIVGLNASSQNTTYTDILQSLGVSYIEIDPTSNKNSGGVTIDFPAVLCSSVNITLQDLTGAEVINLRGIQLWQMVYSGSGFITSNSIPFTAGSAAFIKDDITSTGLTSITYMLSSDGINFSAITPGNITISNPFWYKIVLALNPAGFTASVPTTSDPSASTSYTIVSSSSIGLGANIYQRVITLSSVTGSIVLNEVPLPNTLTVQSGSTLLTVGQYTFANNTISLATTYSSLTISYQISTANTSSLSQLQNYYTPFVNQISFEAI